jgi:hypothetical protein
MSKATNRTRTEEQFWKDVEELLTQHYRHPRYKAHDGIDEYRREIAPQLGEVAYNQGEEQAAKVIDNLIKLGFPSAATK